MLIAGAAGLFGLDDPVRHRLAKDAHDVCEAGRVTILLETPSHRLPPSAEQASTA